MIYVRLMGGLGNQMFQYALGRRLALANHTDLVLDDSFLENSPQEIVPRYYELDCFNIQAKKIVNLDKVTNAKKHALRRFLSPDIATVHEKGFTFDPEILNIADNSLLIGYWQSEKYFDDYKKQIRDDFTFIKPLSKNKQQVADKISGEKNTVALQIRRGDYVSHPVSSKYHGVVALDYYQKAIKEIAKKVKNPVFFVISDDHKWCEANLKINYPTTFVKHIPDTGQENLNLMRMCDHHIIANSSFGWWGAWLSVNPDKIVIAPKKWFKGAKNDTSDLIPEGWVRL